MNMENKYYAYIDDRQVGPLDLNQLADAGVRPSTYIWCKGMDDWQRADEVEEVRNLFLQHLNRRRETREEKRPAPLPEQQRPSDYFNTGSSGAPKEDERPPKFRFGRFGVDLPEPDQIGPDTNNPPQVSMVLAVLALLLCFWPTAIVAIYFTHKAQKTWNGANGNEDMKKRAHDYARLAKMWLGFSVAFGIIAWSVILFIGN